MKLGKFDTSTSNRPFFIAEMSGNHNQSLERALKIVEAAAAAGADALKIQTYTPDTMTLDLKINEFFIKEKSSLWHGRSLYDLYKEAMTPWEWHEPIQKKCHELGMEFFSTPFDSTSVAFLEKLGAPFYKIASFENTDLPLIKLVAQTGKPIIISTGMATNEELVEAVACVRSTSNSDIALLKCTSSYPAPFSDANLVTIRDLASTFDVVSGLSDHTMGIELPIAAVALGAQIIEKHFTLSRKDGGVDSAFSLEPDEFKQMIRSCSNAAQAIGKVSYGPTPAEEKSLVFRRSIYISQDVNQNEVLNEKNVRVIRPGLGLKPKFYSQILGKKFKRSYSAGTPLNEEMFE
jgi:pseudaminic acid synthase